MNNCPVSIQIDSYVNSPEMNEVDLDPMSLLPVVVGGEYMEAAIRTRSKSQKLGTAHQAAQLLQVVMEGNSLTWLYPEGRDSSVIPSFIEEQLPMDESYSDYVRAHKDGKPMLAHSLYLKAYYEAVLDQVWTYLDEFERTPDLIEIDKDAA